jgi:hypothetical protein
MGMELQNLACGLSVEHSYCPVSVRRCDITILRSAPNLQETAGLADGTSDRRAACCERVWRLVRPLAWPTNRMHGSELAAAEHRREQRACARAEGRALMRPVADCWRGSA